MSKKIVEIFVAFSEKLNFKLLKLLSLFHCALKKGEVSIHAQS